MPRGRGACPFCGRGHDRLLLADTDESIARAPATAFRVTTKVQRAHPPTLADNESIACTSNERKIRMPSASELVISRYGKKCLGGVAKSYTFYAESILDIRTRDRIVTALKINAVNDTKPHRHTTHSYRRISHVADLRCFTTPEGCSYLELRDDVSSSNKVVREGDTNGVHGDLSSLAKGNS